MGRALRILLSELGGDIVMTGSMAFGVVFRTVVNVLDADGHPVWKRLGIFTIRRKYVSGPEHEMVVVI